MAQLYWNKCQGDAWCSLLNVNLDHPHFDNMVGVYVIWHAGAAPATVYVGSGTIRDRLRAHRGDPRILRYRDQGLFVTWAAVSPPEGAEKYLSDRLRPLVGERFPAAVHPTEVNTPW